LVGLVGQGELDAIDCSDRSHKHPRRVGHIATPSIR
jgi:hypothetical protein